MNDEHLPEDTGSDTDVRQQGDRETRTSEGSARQLPPPFKPGEICGEFQLERLLGQGSSGCVYRAFDTVSRRSCALKILIATKQHDLRRNKIGFRRMMGVLHPNLMRVDQMHQLDAYLALSMEEIHGETLVLARRRYRKLEPHIAYNKLLSLTRDYASGLSAIHSMGLLHRDIKPSNLMVDRHERGRIIDYGLVGTFDAESDPNCYRDYIAGTPRYISPEAYFEQRYTPSGDIFSLGLVVLEFLNAISGRRNWSRSKETRDEDALLITSAVDSLSESAPNVLREACLEMLQFNPADRPTAMQIARLGLPTARNTVFMGGQSLIGRDDEFAEACHWLGEIYQGKHGRLHIHGPTGIGKSALVDAIEQHLRSLSWGQVFRARCRPRENQPLQAFDQIADQIANRYSKSDREALEVDPVSAAILHQAMPVLRDVVIPNMRLRDAKQHHERVDAIQAVINLSVELRKVGPLIVIIDDVQWADDDTNGTLDSLQTAGGGMLGIITVSRNQESRQQHPAQKLIKIQPLSDEISRSILADAAKRWSVNVSEDTLQKLSEVAGGNPYRLAELTDEFRIGGLLHALDEQNESSVFGLGNLDRLWQRRAGRLSNQARQVLTFIATAGCLVSTNQLAQLSGMSEDVEIAVSELVHNRLITDDATGGCCIQIIHDAVSKGILDQLSEAETTHANLAWAKLLQQQPDPDKFVGRIARHLLDAGQSSEALEYIHRAAQESEQGFAYCDSAEWHLTIAKISGEDHLRRHHLHEAARNFVQADRYVRAAEIHAQLAKDASDPSDALNHRIRKTQLLMRSGRFHVVRDDLNALVEKLGLPRLDTSIPILSSAARSLAIWRGHLFQVRPPQPGTTSKEATPAELQKLAFCKNLIRPMVMFHGAYAGSLFLAAAKMVRQYGSSLDQVELAIASAVFACCDKGAKRADGEALLRDLQATAGDFGDKTTGDYWSAKALASVFSMNWSAVESSVKTATRAYRSSETACLFEIASTRWLSCAAAWYRGDWEQVTTECRDALDDALLRDDRLAHFVATSGMSAAAWLAQDELKAVDRFEKLNDECMLNTGRITDLLRYVAAMQKSLYVGEFEQAFATYESFSRMLSKSQLSRIQIARVLSNQFGVLAALHRNELKTRTELTTAIKTGIKHLRDEQLPCSVMLAELYEGIMSRQVGDFATCRKRMVAAQQLAKELDLMPFALAAEDTIHSLDEVDHPSMLRHRMQNRGIRCPDSFERIYAVAAQH